MRALAYKATGSFGDSRGALAAGRGLLLAALSLAVSAPSLAAGAGAAARAETQAVAAIEKLGGTVRPARDGAGLDVELQLRGRRVTDEGLAHLAALRNVVSLNLRGTAITNTGLARLKGMTTLRRLHLERTAVGDSGVAHLAGLVNLEYLNLYGTRITDTSLDHLKRLRRLRRLYVWRTRVTDAGVARLRKALPELRIVRGVDLSTLPEYVDDKIDVPKPTETLKWNPIADAREAPRSRNGLNTLVFFENRSGHPVKLYWVSYGGQLKLYAILAAGATRQQNSYSRNTWLITDEREKALGFFIVGTEVSRAVIPKPKSGA